MLHPGSRHEPSSPKSQAATTYISRQVTAHVVVEIPTVQSDLSLTHPHFPTTNAHPTYYVVAETFPAAAAASCAAASSFQALKFSLSNL